MTFLVEHFLIPVPGGWDKYLLQPEQSYFTEFCQILFFKSSENGPNFSKNTLSKLALPLIRKLFNETGYILQQCALANNISHFKMVMESGEKLLYKMIMESGKKFLFKILDSGEKH